KAISQGGDIESTLERLFALNAIKPAHAEVTGSTGGDHAKAQPRALWSTSIGSHPSHPSHPSGDRRSSESSSLTPPTIGPTLAGGFAGRGSSGARSAVTPPTPARAAALRAAADSV